MELLWGWNMKIWMKNRAQCWAHSQALIRGLSSLLRKDKVQWLPRAFLWAFGNQVSFIGLHPSSKDSRGEELRGQSLPSSSLKSMRNWWFCCFWLLEAVSSLISKLPWEAPVCKSEHETDDVSLLVVRAGRHQFGVGGAKGSMFLTNGLYRDKSFRWR